MIDINYASELGLKIEGKLKGQGVANIIKVGFTALPPFKIQGLQFDEQKVIAVDISSFFKKSFGLEAVGVLGYDFLSCLVTKIDYANETLSFYHPDSFEYNGEGKVIEAPLETTDHIVPMTADDSYSGKWSLDTGSFDFYSASRRKRRFCS